MIHTELLEHACKLAILSAFIKKERPVSLILLAPPESGKSEILKKFAFVSSVKISSDFNIHHFADYCTEYQMGLKRTLIFPDFLKVVKKKYSAQVNAMGYINAITEEGWVGKLPLGQTVNSPIVGNVLTGLTEDELRDKRFKWTRLGFLSRFVPLSYKYKDETKTLIRQYIKDRLYRKDDPYDFTVPKSEVDVMLPNAIANKIEGIVLHISEETNLLGFRLQRQLQTLALANALSCQRTVVTEDDFKVIEALSCFINFDFNPL
jgi:hypothetical protein